MSTFIDTQKAMFLAAAAVEHSSVPETQREQRLHYSKIIAADLWQSFDDAADKEDWTQRAQRLLRSVNTWLDRYDDAGSGEIRIGSDERS